MPFPPFLLAILAFLLAAAPVHAACTGENLINALPAEERAALDSAVNSVPYPRGNLWQATRDGQTVTLAGTYHMDDPRHAAIIDRLRPLVMAARTLLVEAGPEEEKQLLAQIARDPQAILTSEGPTLAEVLPDEEWAVLADAMRNRGVPPLVASRFRPWYVTMLLSIPPCAMKAAAARNGLDQQLIRLATNAGIPVRALEPFDTALKIFDKMPPDAQLGLIRSTLVLESRAADQMVTLADLYFAGDSRRMWEYLRRVSRDLPGATAETVDAEFAAMEEALMATRNRSWIPVIEAAAAEGPAFAGFGALHLSGQDGVLALLERAGWTLRQLTP